MAKPPVAYQIQKIAIVGGGTMGIGIACNFAMAGFATVLFSSKNSEILLEKIKWHLSYVLSPDELPSTLQKITLEKYDYKSGQGLEKIATCDWVIESIIEEITAKKRLLKHLEKFRKQRAIISSNTSSIPLYLMLSESSANFQRSFFVTHFFNPPAKLKLLEVIPHKKCPIDTVNFLLDFARVALQKQTVIAKDTPGFIANRVGIYSLINTVRVAMALHLSVGEVDFLTGEIIGRPKSATFKTIDFIGVDVVCNICETIFKHHPTPKKTGFDTPQILKTMHLKNRLGYKTKAGFYKKNRGINTDEILQLDVYTENYTPIKTTVQKSIPLEILNLPLEKRINALLKMEGVYGDFYRQIFTKLASHIQNCTREITDDKTAIEKAMRFGFGWHKLFVDSQ